MRFNSIDFALFLPVVFLLYWLLAKRQVRWQNALVVAASYFFYGWWDWRFLSLIVFSTLVDYSVGLALGKTTHSTHRKLLLWVSILVNLGLLGYFKYFNFFVENFVDAFTLLGLKMHSSSLGIILPVGISFYTFQTMSYTLDVYKKKLSPTTDLLAFGAYVSFFPQLVAGPIERATHFLPQFFQPRSFDAKKAVDGLRQILWGLFKKIVIADNCAEFANRIFNSNDELSGSLYLLGAFFFTFQIYADFSGYSDIAIGTGRLFGFNLRRNFAFPYFSRDIAEFWRRWHISLSSWFRDYLYIPLGGSRGDEWQTIRNIFIIFIVSGFWHGAKWTFLVWGALNAFYFLPLLLARQNRKHLDIIAAGKIFPSGKEFGMMVLTFGLTVFAWLFFRAESMTQAINIVHRIFSTTLYDHLNWAVFDGANLQPVTLFVLLGLFIGIEWLGREGAYAIARLGLQWKRPLRWLAYYLIIIAIFYFEGREQDFIYFQF